MAKNFAEVFKSGATLTAQDLVDVLSEESAAEWLADHGVMFEAVQDGVTEMHIYQIEGDLESLLQGYPVIDLSPDKKSIVLSSAYGFGKENEIHCTSVTVS